MGRAEADTVHHWVYGGSAFDMLPQAQNHRQVFINRWVSIFQGGKHDIKCLRKIIIDVYWDNAESVANDQNNWKTICCPMCFAHQMMMNDNYVRYIYWNAKLKDNFEEISKIIYAGRIAVSGWALPPFLLVIAHILIIPYSNVSRVQ